MESCQPIKRLKGKKKKNKKHIACWIPRAHSEYLVLTAFPRGLRKLSRYSDSPRAGRSGNLIPVGAKYSAPVQTGPGAHAASYTMGTGSFPGVKPPEFVVDHPPPPSAGVKERVYLYSYTSTPPLGLRGLL